MTYPDPPEPTDVEDLKKRVEIFTQAASDLAFNDQPTPAIASTEEQAQARLDELEAHVDIEPLVVQSAQQEPASARADYAADAVGPRDSFRSSIFQEVLAERTRQFDKWGDQERPLGASATYKQIADIQRENCNEAELALACTWRHIALEEVWEAFSESDRDAFRIEAVQTIAVLFSALEDLFRDEFTS